MAYWNEPSHSHSQAITANTHRPTMWWSTLSHQPSQEAFLQISRRTLFGVVFSLDLRYYSLVSGPVSGISSFLHICGVLGWTPNVVHPLLCLWLLMDSITTTRFRLCLLVRAPPMLGSPLIYGLSPCMKQPCSCCWLTFDVCINLTTVKTD